MLLGKLLSSFTDRFVLAPRQTLRPPRLFTHFKLKPSPFFLSPKARPLRGLMALVRRTYSPLSPLAAATFAAVRVWRRLCTHIGPRKQFVSLYRNRMDKVFQQVLRFISLYLSLSLPFIHFPSVCAAQDCVPGSKFSANYLRSQIGH